MASYTNRTQPKNVFNESIQFTYNKKPFSSKERAESALKAKNLLPGEPAVAYYYDDNKKLSTLLAIGTLHDSNSTLIISGDNSSTIISNSSVSDDIIEFVEALKQNASTMLLDSELTNHLQTLFDNSSTWAANSETIKELADESAIQNASINALENIVVEGGEVEL